MIGINQKSMLSILAIVALLCVSLWHEAISLRVSEEGYYKGTVIDKTVSVGRSSTHYLYIAWDGIGPRSISVHPMTYKRTVIGDRFSTQYGYMPIFGAAGSAYVPDTDEYSATFAITGFISKLILIGFSLHLFCRKVDRFTNKRKKPEHNLRPVRMDDGQVLWVGESSTEYDSLNPDQPNPFERVPKDSE